MTHQQARHAAGLRPHTGWVALVVVDDELKLLDRRRVSLLDAELPRQVFHNMRGLDQVGMDRLLARVRESAAAAAGALMESLATGVAVTGIGVVAWQPSVPDEIEEILRSHQLMHAAEGDLYRRVLLDAAAARGVPVESFLPANLAATTASIAGHDIGEVTRQLAKLGRRFGPPWQKDQKEATLAAWAMLYLTSRRPGVRPRRPPPSLSRVDAGAASSPAAPEAVRGHRRH